MDPLETAFTHAQGMSLFDWMKLKPLQRKHFDRYMASRRRGIQKWFEIFPVAEFLEAGSSPGPQDVLLVDIGGSHGHDLQGFNEQFKGTPGRRILQDLPETIDSFISLPSNIEAMAHDFFTPQPVLGAYSDSNHCRE